MRPDNPASPAPRLRVESPGVGTQQAERVRRIALRALAVSAALVAIPFPVALLLDSMPICMVTLAGVLGTMGSSLALLLGPTARTVMRPGVVSVEGAAITVDQRGHDQQGNRRIYPMRDVVEGWLEEPDEVYLRMQGGETLVVKVTSTQEGERLLAAADLSASERVVRMPLTSAASTIPFGRGLAILGMVVLSPVAIFSAAVVAAMVKDLAELFETSGVIGAGMVLAFTATLGFILYTLIAALRRREVTVGTDGLVYRSTFGRDFIPYAQVTQVAADPRGVRVVRGSSSVVLPTSEGALLPPPGQSAALPSTAAGVKRRDALLDRIKGAMAARRVSGSVSANLTHLDRKGRPLLAWREDLQRLIKAPSLYRGAGFAKSELAEVIEDPGASPERRVGAALALQVADPEETRRRVRVAVEACADDDLRSALESAAEGEVAEGQLEKLRFRV